MSDGLSEIAKASSRPTREEALRVADDLLRRLAEWDMLNFYIGQAGEPIEPTADAPYWRGQIAEARGYIALARGE